MVSEIYRCCSLIKDINMGNKFKKGDFVCAKVKPLEELIVRIFARKIYYCIIVETGKEVVYFEKELELYNK